MNWQMVRNVVARISGTPLTGFVDSSYSDIKRARLQPFLAVIRPRSRSVRWALP